MLQTVVGCSRESEKSNKGESVTSFTANWLYSTNRTAAILSCKRKRNLDGRLIENTRKSRGQGVELLTFPIGIC